MSIYSALTLVEVFDRIIGRLENFRIVINSCLVNFASQFEAIIFCIVDTVEYAP